MRCAIASCVIAPIGVRRVKTSGTSSTSGSSAAAAKNPASVVRDVAYSPRIASPSRMPERLNLSRLAGTDEKVLDSCWKPAVAIRIIAVDLSRALRRPAEHVAWMER
jgi:hypothetical protein